MKRCILVTITVFVCLAQPTVARAGTIDVDVCHTPWGEFVGTTGWTTLNPSPAYRYDLLCNDGGFGVATQQGAGPFPAKVFTGWRYPIPKPLYVDGYAGAWLIDNSDWGWEGGMAARRFGEPGWVGVSYCNMSGCGDTGWFITTPPLEEVAVGIECRGAGQPCPVGSGASIDVKWLRLRVNDPAAPKVTPTGGGLVGNAPIQGVSEVAFKASDRGVGLLSVRLEADGGVPLGTRDYTTRQPSCARPYRTTTPCAQDIADSISVDTTSLSDGVHSFRLVVRDASGNESSSEWTATVANLTVSGLCASKVESLVSLRLSPRSLAFGKPGTLTVRWRTIPWEDPDGVLLQGAEKLTLGPRIVTRRDRFLVDVPPGVSRTVRVGFRAPGSTGPYMCTRTIRVAVRAGLKLRAHPQLLRNGSKVRLRGVLAGGQVAAGRAVVLEARARGGRRRWTPVKVVRTAASGRFGFSYRFSRTTTRTKFVFRARVAATRGFPYATGVSRERAVTVVP